MRGRSTSFAKNAGQKGKRVHNENGCVDMREVKGGVRMLFDMSVRSGAEEVEKLEAAPIEKITEKMVKVAEEMEKEKKHIAFFVYGPSVKR